MEKRFLQFYMAKKHIKNKIKKLSIQRKKLIDNHENSYDESIGEFGDYNIPWDNTIDTLENEINDLLKAHHSYLPIDFVIEELTKLGGAPCVLYDDNGHFAVSGDGYQTLALDENPVDMNMSHHIHAHMWKKTIREALTYYIESE